MSVTPDDVELRELRDALNTTRVVVKSLQNQARTAVRLAHDLEERLERFDTRLWSQRQAQEAQHDHDHGPQARREGISQISRLVA